MELVQLVAAIKEGAGAGGPHPHRQPARPGRDAGLERANGASCVTGTSGRSRMAGFSWVCCLYFLIVELNAYHRKYVSAKRKRKQRNDH